MSQILDTYSLRISGIKSKPELNGQVARLMSGASRSGRYPCKLANEQEVSLKWESIELTNPRKDAMIERKENQNGAGLFAKEFIAKGTFLFKGENPPLHVDVDELKTFWRFSVNHSCSPNVISTSIPSGEEFFFALRDISLGEELGRCYSSACVWSPKAMRQGLLENHGITQCLCVGCKNSSTADDSLRVKIHELATAVYCSAWSGISLTQWETEVKPFLLLDGQNPAKAMVGYGKYRGIYSGLLQQMLRAKFVGRDDQKFEECLQMVKIAYTSQLMLLGFPNNMMRSDENFMPKEIRNVDREIARLSSS